MQEDKTKTKISAEEEAEIIESVKRATTHINEQREKDISRRQLIFKRILTAVFVLLVVAVLAYTFWEDFFSSDKTPPSPQTLANIVGQCWVYILCAFAALACCFLLKGLKLSVLLKSLSGKFYFKTGFETGIIGHYYNCVTPLAVGGQPFEIYHMTKNGVKPGVAASASIFSYFLHQFAFVVLAVTALVFYRFNVLQIPPSFRSAFSGYSGFLITLAIIGSLCCFLVPLLVVIFCILPKVGGSLVKAVVWLGGKLRIIRDPEKTTLSFMKTVANNARCLKMFAKKPLTVLTTFIMSLAEHFALCSLAYFSLRIFGFDIDSVVAPNPNGVWEWGLVIEFALILYAAISFVPTPGNSGAADLSFFLLFESGLEQGFAFPAMLVWRILSFYAFIVVGFFFNLFVKRREKKNPKIE